MEGKEIAARDSGDEKGVHEALHGCRDVVVKYDIEMGYEFAQGIGNSHAQKVLLITNRKLSITCSSQDFGGNETGIG